jgi:hypothetical protein
MEIKEKEELINYINDYVNAKYNAGLTIGTELHKQWVDDAKVCYEKLINYINQPQEEWDHNHIKRMPSHFFIVERKSADDILIAVSEDNQMYWIVPANNIDGKWEKLPPIPQD